MGNKSKKLPIKGYKDYATRRNSEVFWYNYNKLKMKAISMFEWINLPPEIDARYLELMLCERGYVCFFKDDPTSDRKSLNNSIEEYGVYMALQCTLSGYFNIYNIPTKYHVFTASGYQADRTANDSVIIWNNLLHSPTTPLLMYHAYNITNVDRTIEVNLNQLKRPFIFLVPENQRFTFEKLITDIERNANVVIGNKNLDIENVNLISTVTPNNTNDLYTLKKRYYNEALTDLGINNLSSDKKERLVSDEVTSNDEDIFINRQAMLAARKMACKQINEMFGLNIDVRYRFEEREEDIFDMQYNDNEGVDISE